MNTTQVYYLRVSTNFAAKEILIKKFRLGFSESFQASLFLRQSPSNPAIAGGIPPRFDRQN
jgi:hypothetical protein